MTSTAIRRVRPEPVSSPLGRLALAAAVLLFVLVVVRTAWMADDAFITLRTVQNFVDGYGPRWNELERVQTFTHPLWMLIVSAAFSVTREAYFTTLAVSLGCSVAAVTLLLRRASSAGTLVLCAMLIVSSRAFVDYSTSGLENPLTHLCLAIAAALLQGGAPTSRRLGALTLTTALAMLTRLDSGLLLLPALAELARRAGWRASIPPVLAGFLPLAVWHIFALVYYGTPFPNTAYAKMATGLTLGEYVGQGTVYLRESLASDPVTLVTVALGLVLIIAARIPHRWTITAGVLLHLAYVVRVGGDFMSGRFLTGDFFWVVLTLRQLPYSAPTWTVSLPMVLIVLLARTGSSPSLASTAAFGTVPGGAIPPNGIVDERFYYYQATGLLRTNRIFHPPLSEEPRRVQRMLDQQRLVVPREAVGLFGFHAGRRLHVLDVLGLGDPLLARLPTQRPWRIGHFSRRIPEGYEQSLATGTNVIEDANLRRYYDDLSMAIRGALWSRARWAAIARLNLGVDDAYLAPSRRGLFSVWSTSIPAAPQPNDLGDIPTVDIRHGLHVMLPAAADLSRVEISVDPSTDYRVSALRSGEIVRSELLRSDPRASGALSTRVLDLAADGHAIDAVEIVPLRGDPPYRLSSLDVVLVPASGSAR